MYMSKIRNITKIVHNAMKHNKQKYSQREPQKLSHKDFMTLFLCRNIRWQPKSTNTSK